MTVNLTRNHAIMIGVLVAAIGLGVWALSRDTRNPEWLRDKYGITNAFTERVDTPDGTVTASLIPVTLANGTTAYLVVPQRGNDQLYLKDGNHLVPVESTDRALDRERFVSSGPVIVERPKTSGQETAVTTKKKRSTKDEVLIVAGGAGAGAAVGGVAGGGKGAAIGAVSGGVAGLIYDIATRGK